jgi:uncharacterized protein
VIYLDSCALVKLIREEDESEALQEWLDERDGELVVTSELAQAEVRRVVVRSNHTDQGALIDADELAAELAEAEAVLDMSALELEPAATEFVTYDKRLATIAHAAGLTVLSPS